MRLLHLPTFWTVVIDFIAWTIIHLGVVFVSVRLPGTCFHPGGWLYRSRTWEKEGSLYHKVFKIRRWKEHLPDAAPFLGSRGFPKKRLKEKSRPYFHAFLIETCRAELTHWLVLCFAPFFFFWNPPGAGLVMILYGLIENIPLIMTQRYNRCRLNCVLKTERPRS